LRVEVAGRRVLLTGDCAGEAVGGKLKIRRELEEEPFGEMKVSEKCTLRLDGGAQQDRLRFKVVGTYDEATGASAVECKGRGWFSNGAKIRIEDFVVRDGEIISGRIGGRAFGQEVVTPVLYTPSM
jgi:hypothetical protein